MLHPALLPAFFRELLIERPRLREPEPDLVMDGPEQVAAYAEAGRVDGLMAASYLFHSARVSQTIAGAEHVLDLGCGPGTQLAQIAELNPYIRFTGLDLSPVMIADGQRHVRGLGLKNVAFRQGDISALTAFPDHSMDAVISTMALHHLPRIELLASCMREITRVLKPGGAIYLADFGRLKSLKTVLFFAYRHADVQPPLFSLDFERSMRAAFLLDDFKQLAQAHLPPSVQVYSTFKVPFKVIVKTPERGLSPELSERLRRMYRALKPRYRRDMTDLRRFFWLGGLPNDPF